MMFVILSDKRKEELPGNCLQSKYSVESAEKQLPPYRLAAGVVFSCFRILIFLQ